MEEGWVHVTSLLENASAQLHVGELLSTPTFNLFDAMSAAEVGNPKLDVGMQKAKSAEKLIEEGAAPLQLSLTQLLSVVDHLLTLEASWHLGGSLPHTIYSSLYMLAIERIAENTALYAFCKCLQVTCSEVCSLVVEGCVCEEEDFNALEYGLPVGDSRTDAAAAAAALSLALDQLQAAAAMDNGKTQDSPHSAIASRLRFRSSFLSGLQKLRRKGKSDLEQAAKQFSRALVELRVIATTSTPDEIIGFSSTVNRHLHGPAPPRVVQILSKDETWAYFERLLNQLLTVCTIIKVADLRSLKHMLETFARGSPVAVARTCLHIQLAYKSWEGHQPPAWAPSAAMLRDAWNLSVAASDRLGADFELFMEQALIAVGNWCQTMLLNRARQRRRHRRSLDDWANLYQHALNADCSEPFIKFLKNRGWTWTVEDPQELQGVLGSWVEKETCSVILQHLLLGFELELYAPQEYSMLFWYSDYLWGVMYQDLAALHAAQPRPQPRPQLASKAAARAELMRSESARMLLTVESLALAALRYMAQAMLRLMLGLQLAGLLQPPSLPFNTELQRFEQRFAFLQGVVRPEPLMYEQYQAASHPRGHTAEQLLEVAAHGFAQARQAIASFSQVLQQLGLPQDSTFKAMDRVALQNTVAITVVAKSKQTGAQLSTQFDLSHHPFFPVLSLKGAKKS